MDKLKNIAVQHWSKGLLLVDQGIVSGGNFITGVLLARELGLAVYGEFTLAWMVVLVCSSLQQGWLISPMFTFVPKYSSNEKAQYLQTLLVHQLLFSTMAAVVTGLMLRMAGSLSYSQTASDLQLLLPVTVFGFLMYDFFRRRNYALGNTGKALITDLLVYGVQISGMIGLKAMNMLTLSTVFQLLGCSFLIAIALERRQLMKVKWSKSAFCSVALKHWAFSRWLIGTSLLQWVSGNFFIVAAGGLLSPAAVGAIRVLQNIVGVLHVLFLAAENYVPLRASKVLQFNGVDQLEKFLRQVTWKGSLITLLLAGTIAVFGKEVIALLYQDNYTEYAYLLYGFAMLYVLVFVGTNFRFAIRTLEKTRAIFFAAVCSAVFSLTMAKPIIQSFGIEGVIVGLIASQLIMQCCFMYELRNKLNILWKLST